MVYGIHEVKKYGRRVWQNSEMDFRRSDSCMCLSCSISESCETATTLFDICVDKGMALMITRCAEYIGKDK